MDGIYIIHTPVPAAELDATGVVTAYKDLAYVERGFRHLKADDLDLRPIHHWLDDRVGAHVLICMLAAYLTWHLCAALAPSPTSTSTPAPHGPRRSRPPFRARRRQSRHPHQRGLALRSYQGLLGHLATLTRNTIAIGGTTFEKISDPTPPAQRQAFDLIGAPIPPTQQKTPAQQRCHRPTPRNFGQAISQARDDSLNRLPANLS